MVLALLPSPLLGPAVWRPVAQKLTARGWQVIVPAASQAAPRSPDDVRRSILAALPAEQDLVLIPHSNAGLYVPALTTERSVAGYVFVDGRLPSNDGRIALAPSAFLELLALKADNDGLLPPWTRWWDEAHVASLFPDYQTRETVEREQRRIPLSYFRDSLPVPSGWDRMPGAYLAFGDTYASDRREAAGRAWPTSTLVGGHLHMLVEPDRVAAEIVALLEAMGVEPNRR
jgi:hypothetical protein